ncbi:MAG: TolC family protein [Cocleimonas sp.]
MKKLLIVIPLIALSACSSTHTLKQLQSEYDGYTYSAYVSDNLKTQEPQKAQPEVGLNRKKLKQQIRQLASKKKQAGGRINGVISQNNLYQPSRTMLQKVASLKLGKQSQIWLKNNASLDAVITLALRNNLDIKSAKEQAESNLAKYDQVGFLDDMLAQYAAFTQDIKLTGSTQKHKKKSVNAGFPFPGLLAIKASIIDQSVEVSRQALKQTTQDVITKTRVAYHELQYSQQDIDITTKKTKLLRSLKEELESNYSTNSAELSGVLLVDIEIANSQNKRQIAKDKQQAQKARLFALLNLPSDSKLGKLDKLKSAKLSNSSAMLIKQAQENRVEISRLKASLEKMKRIIQLSEKRFYPDFDAGFSRFQNGKFSTKPKIKQNNFFAKNDAYLTETRQKYQALQSKIKALQTKTADDVQQLISNYKTQKRTYVLYQDKLLPKARTTKDISKSLFETGETSFIEVIDAQEMILNFRLKSKQALKNMNISKAKLMRIVGVNRS